MLDLSGQTCLQRLWPKLGSGASSAMYGLVDLPQQLVLQQQGVLSPHPFPIAALAEELVEAKGKKKEYRSLMMISTSVFLTTICCCV